MINCKATTGARGASGLRRFLFTTVASCAVLASSAAAQQELETVTVTGYRASLEKSLDLKRATNEMVDAIYAEDVGKFPDSNLAESLQRLPGVAIDKESGEGRQITVRGLSSLFTRVTLNGMETLATAGASQGSGSAPNRDRGFDFNTFASELFGSLRVQKTASAATEEGSLGATVGLHTPRPFDYGDKFVIGGQNAWFETGKPFNPRVTAVGSKLFFGGRLGVLASVAYNSRTTNTDSFNGNYGLLYQQTQGATPRIGTVYPTGFDNSSNFTTRAGFAAPTGSVCDGTVAPYTNGVIPGFNVTNDRYCSAMSGSNPAAYAAVNSPTGGAYADTNAATGAYTAVQTGPGPTTIIPNLITLTHQTIYQRKFGTTASVQWQIDDKTLLTVDGLASFVYQDGINYQMQTLSFNRGSTPTLYNVANDPSTMTDATLKGLGTFQSCVTSGSTDTITGLPRAPVDCGAKLYGTTVIGGTQASYNPNNLDPYDYYATAYSAAHNLPSASKANMVNTAISFVGRSATKVKAAQVVPGPAWNVGYPLASADPSVPGAAGGTAVYLQTDNNGFRTAADQVFYSTQFEQLSTNFKRDFGKLKVDITAGWSRSYNHQDGYLAEFNKFDVHADNYSYGTYADTPNATGYYTFDARAGGPMPQVTFGFNAADPSNWDFYKGFSALRHYAYITQNNYRGLIGAVTYELSNQVTISAGINFRIYDFATSYYQRVTRDTVNPSLAEMGVTTADVSQTINWGAGLSAPAGTTTSWIGPDLDKFKKASGLACNCINKYGDWTISNLVSPVANAATGTYSVSEHSKSYYAQIDFQDIMIFHNPLKGNIGARMVMTDVSSVGHSISGLAVADSNSYTNFLPAINLVYMLGDDMDLRAASSLSMARSSLANMSPGITAISIPNSTTRDPAVIGTVSLGNPRLRPYRAISLDLGWEWYFTRGGLVSVTGFMKWLKDNPQQTVFSGTASTILPATALAGLKTQYSAACTNQGGAPETTSITECNQAAFLNADGSMTATQYLNGLGGRMAGFEGNYQQQLDFIPAVLGGKGLGINLNATVIWSKQHYILSANATGLKFQDAGWPGTSPQAANATVYYDGDRWSVRLTGTYRAGYIKQYPLAYSASDVMGIGSKPTIFDFARSLATTGVDGSFNWSITDSIDMSANVINILDSAARESIYTNPSLPQLYSNSGRQVFAGFRYKY